MMRSAIFLLSLVLATVIAGGNAALAHSATISGIARTANTRCGSSSEDAEPAKPAPQIIVIGFVGGFVRHDDLVHSGVQLAARLRQDFPSGVYINTFENHQGDQAHREVLHLLDIDHDGTLSADENRNARVVIYGHSWGASEIVALAKQLNRDGIPVLLTIQVDSVEKSGEDDSVTERGAGRQFLSERRAAPRTTCDSRRRSRSHPDLGKFQARLRRKAHPL
jgi:hypothetical protein